MCAPISLYIHKSKIAHKFVFVQIRKAEVYVLVYLNKQKTVKLKKKKQKNLF